MSSCQVPGTLLGGRLHALQLAGSAHGLFARWLDFPLPDSYLQNKEHLVFTHVAFMSNFLC